jgi:hypothetical protein
MSNGNVFSIDIQGLDELRSQLNLDRIQKDIAVNIGTLSRSVVNTLRQEVTSRYNISANKFDSSLLGQSSSNQVTGRNLILNSLEFKDTPVNLAKFVTTVAPGNIQPFPKKRGGKIHSVTIKRGQEKVSYGEHGFGGFTIKGGTVMVERTGPGRNAPLKTMYAPNVVDMVNWTIDNNTKVQQSFETFTQNVLDNLDL